MSQESQRVLITGKMVAANFGIPIRYPNIPWNQPDNTVYGEFFIMGGAAPIPIGGQGEGKIVERIVQMIQLTVWVPQDDGTKAATLAIDKFEATFAYKIGRCSEGAIYHFKGMQPMNPSTRDNWTCLIGRIAFLHDQIKNVDIAATIL